MGSLETEVSVTLGATEDSVALGDAEEEVEGCSSDRVPDSVGRVASDVTVSVGSMSQVEDCETAESVIEAFAAVVGSTEPVNNVSAGNTESVDDEGAMEGADDEGSEEGETEVGSALDGDPVSVAVGTGLTVSASTQMVSVIVTGTTTVVVAVIGRPRSSRGPS